MGHEADERILRPLALFAGFVIHRVGRDNGRDLGRQALTADSFVWLSLISTAVDLS